MYKRQDQTKENKKVKEIKIGTMDLVNPDLVARKEKYYEKQLGVKVKIVKFDSGKDVNTALAVSYTHLCTGRYGSKESRI